MPSCARRICKGGEYLVTDGEVPEEPVDEDTMEDPEADQVPQPR